MLHLKNRTLSKTYIIFFADHYFSVLELVTAGTLAIIVAVGIIALISTFLNRLPPRQNEIEMFRW